MESSIRSLRSASPSKQRGKQKRALRSSGPVTDQPSSSHTEQPAVKKVKKEHELTRIKKKEDVKIEESETMDCEGENPCEAEEKCEAQKECEAEDQPLIANRPRRNKAPKTSNTMGLSWREEHQLQRALLASLHSKKCPERSSSESDLQLLTNKRDNQEGSDTCSQTSKDSEKLKLVMPGPCPSSGNDTPSPDCLATKLLFQKTQLRAQRKFAQGSRSCSPSTTPVKTKTINTLTQTQPDMSNCRAKTEDFLTFLCLRGTSLMPSHLEHFNYPEHEEVSCPGTPATSYSRSSTPAYKSTTPSNRQSPDRETNSLSDLGVEPLPPSPNKKPSHSRKQKHHMKSKQIQSPFCKTKKHVGPLRKIRGHSIRGSEHSATSRKWPASYSMNQRKKSSSPSRNLRSRRATDEPEMKSPVGQHSISEKLSQRGSYSHGKHHKDKKTHSSHSKIKVRKMSRKAEIAEADSTTPASKHDDSDVIIIEDSPDVVKHRHNSPASAKATPSPNKGESSPGCSRHSSSIPTISLSFREYFPAPTDLPRIVQVPTYHPSAEEFVDPMSYIKLIQPDAQSFGICKIVPPEGWKPECKISQDLRFSTQQQDIHRLMDRWGSNAQQLECIRHHIVSQGGTLDHPPVVGSLELDLPGLSAAVQQCGGLQSILDDNSWGRVAELLRHPRPVQEIQARLYEVYCRYLLSYDTLTTDERNKLHQVVTHQRLKQKRNNTLDLDCMSKGRSRSLSEYFRAARNMQAMFFKDGVEPSPAQVENEYWRLVEQGKHHVSVHAAHLDSATHGSAFPTRKDSPYARHGWNFSMLHHNPENVLSHVSHIPGVTRPMLHIGMLFSSSCWSRDPHFLPVIHYIHSGADTIWYCVPDSESSKLKSAMEQVVPDLIDADQPIWLPEDSVMLSQSLLIEKGLSLCRAVQQQGEFIVVFPKAFTANISCGYNIAESINFAPLDWLPSGLEAAKLLAASGEPDLFSMDRLLVALSQHSDPASLPRVTPHFKRVIEREASLRKQLREAGLKNTEKVSSDKRGPRELPRCHVTQALCYLSMVVNEKEDKVYCLEEGLKVVQRRKNLKHFTLRYTYHQKDILSILHRAEQRAQSHDATKGPKLKKALNA